MRRLELGQPPCHQQENEERAEQRDSQRDSPRALAPHAGTHTEAAIGTTLICETLMGELFFYPIIQNGLNFLVQRMQIQV